MTLEEHLEAIDRAFATEPKGEPLVSEEKKKEMLVDIESSIDRAFEHSAVTLANSDVETEESSLFDRFFSEPYDKAIQRQAEVFQRIASTSQANTREGMQAALADPEILKEQYRQSTNLGSVLLQTVTTPLSLLFDSASEMVMFGAGAGVAMLPEGLREGAKEEFKALMETEAGQLAWNAAGQGKEAWDRFKETNPNEAANLVSVMELGFTKGSGSLVKQPYKPMKLERVGLRNEVKPLAGGDADVYEVLFGGDKKTTQQVRLTEDPKGILGTQEQLASAEQLDLIDMAKSAGVSGNKTLQQNYNAFQRYYDKLEDNLMKMLARNERKINWAQIDQNLRLNVKAQFDEVVASNPKLMSNKAARQEMATLYNDFLSILDEQGGTLQGLRVARSMFDDRLSRMGYDLSGDALTTRNLSAMSVRRAVNQTVYDVVPETETIFSQMSKMIPALGTLSTKAATEAKTRFGRFITQLGLPQYSGNTALSVAANAVYVLGGTVLASPYFYIKNQLKRPSPAKARAKLSYIKRDMFEEIAKAIKATKDPVKRSVLSRDSKEVYTYLNAVFKSIEQELEEEKEASNG